MIPYEKLKTRLKEMIYSAFLNQNRTTCYKFIILGIIVYTLYFVNELSFKPCYTNEQVISKLEFFFDNIFVDFGGRIFKQVVRTNCGAPVLAHPFLFFCGSDFYQTPVKTKTIKEAIHLSSHTNIFMMFFS